MNVLTAAQRYNKTQRNMFIAELQVQLRLQGAALVKMSGELAALRLQHWHIKRLRIAKYRALRKAHEAG